jgi:hypothetical protein
MDIGIGIEGEASRFGGSSSRSRLDEYEDRDPDGYTASAMTDGLGGEGNPGESGYAKRKCDGCLGGDVAVSLCTLDLEDGGKLEPNGG